MNTDKPILLISYPCYYCEGSNYFYRAGQLLRHLSTVHQLDYPSRSQGRNREYSQQYRYATDGNRPYDEEQFGCPCCWFHTSKLAELKDHLEKNHEGVQVSKPDYKQYVYRGDYYDRGMANSIMNSIYGIATTFKDHLQNTFQ